jgi:Tol biopolymer transport system component
MNRFLAIFVATAAMSLIFAGTALAKIAFVSQQLSPNNSTFEWGDDPSSNLWTMNDDGSNQIQVTSGAAPSLPTWAPDGGRLAFVEDSNGEASDSIRVLDAATLRVRTVFQPKARWDILELDWSPRGDWIAMFATKESDNSKDIWLIRPDGSGLRFAGLPGDDNAPCGWATGTTIWMPGGSELYSGWRGAFSVSCAGSDGNRPVTALRATAMNIETGAVRNITDSAALDNRIPSDTTAFAPDGSAMAAEFAPGLASSSLLRTPFVGSVPASEPVRIPVPGGKMVESFDVIDPQRVVAALDAKGACDHDGCDSGGADIYLANLSSGAFTRVTSSGNPQDKSYEWESMNANSTPVWAPGEGPAAPAAELRSWALKSVKSQRVGARGRMYFFDNLSNRNTRKIVSFGNFATAKLVVRPSTIARVELAFVRGGKVRSKLRSSLLGTTKQTIDIAGAVKKLSSGRYRLRVRVVGQDGKASRWRSKSVQVVRRSASNLG